MREISLILETDTDENVPIEVIKKDLIAEISSASYDYTLKECEEINSKGEI